MIESGVRCICRECPTLTMFHSAFSSVFKHDMTGNDIHSHDTSLPCLHRNLQISDMLQTHCALGKMAACK